MANPILQNFLIKQPPRNTASVTLADCAYNSIIFVLAVAYFLAIAVPICLVLVFHLERKTKVVTLADYIASANTKKPLAG